MFDKIAMPTVACKSLLGGAHVYLPKSFPVFPLFIQDTLELLLILGGEKLIPVLKTFFLPVFCLPGMSCLQIFSRRVLLLFTQLCKCYFREVIPDSPI